MQRGHPVFEPRQSAFQGLWILFDDIANHVSVAESQCREYVVAGAALEQQRNQLPP
jgi:hypothetical protein